MDIKKVEEAIQRIDQNLDTMKETLPDLINVVKTTQDMEFLRKASNQILFNLVMCLEYQKTSNEFHKYILSTIKKEQK